MPVLKQKLQPAPMKSEGEAVRTSLEQQIAEERKTIARLQKLEREDAEKAAAAYNAGAAPEPEARVVRRHLVDALLAGAEILGTVTPRDRIVSIEQRLDATREALRIATQRLQRLFDARTEEIAAEFAPIWREHLSRVMAHVNGLVDLARERHKFLDQLSKESGIRLQPDFSAALDEMVAMTDWADPDRVHPDSVVGQLREAMQRADVR
jgi:hypothetical protein